MHPPLARALAIVICVGGGTWIRAAEPGDLRLVAAAGHTAFTPVTAGQQVSTPDPTAWRLTGDLRAHAGLFLFSPEYEIVTTLARADMDPDPVLRHAIIRPRRNSAWSEAELKDGVLVFVWLVEQQPVAILPVPAFDRKGSAAAFAAVATIPLTESTARGTPTVLLWKGGKFIPPKATFRNQAAQAALAALHLAPAEEGRTVLAGLRDPSVRAEITPPPPTARSAWQIFVDAANQEVAPVAADRRPPPPTLLYYAAAGGFPDAVAALLASGASLDRETAAWGPLQAAASNGRHEVIRLLLPDGPTEDARRRWVRSALSVAMTNGHAAAASALVAGASAAEILQVIGLANTFADAVAIRDLLARGARAEIVQLSTRSLANSVRHGRWRHVEALLEAGLPADANDGGTPLLVAAAAGGRVECLEVLLRAGASIAAQAPGGITALMAATARGDAAMVAALLAAGADPEARDDEGRTALHHAVLGGRMEIIGLLLKQPRAPMGADHRGQTPLHLALAMQSRLMVELLVENGARLAPQDLANVALVQQIMAVDAVVLLTQAGVTPEDTIKVFRGPWSAAQVAAIYDASRCAAWLGNAGALGPSSSVTIVRPDVAPAVIAGKNPVEPRDAEDFFPVDEVKISGIVSADGEFLFPRITAARDVRTGSAALDAASTWRFRPGTRQGAAVVSRVTVSIPFPARDRRIHAATDLDRLPTLSSTAPAVPDVSPATHDLGGRAASDHFAAVTFVVEPDGKPGAVQVIRAVRPRYAKMVESTILRSRFAPGIIDGQPVRARITLTFPLDGS